MILTYFFSLLTILSAKDYHNVPNEVLLSEILDLKQTPSENVPKHFSKNSWFVETPKWFKPVPYMGYTQKENLTIRSVLRHRNKIIWNKTYHTDSDGNRSRPPGRQYSENKDSIYLMGCSYIFGPGLNDNETITHQLGNLLPNYNVKNISTLGSGPHMTLAQLQNETKYYSASPREDIYIYNYSELEHLARANGLMKELSWTAITPYYEIIDEESRERLVTKGNFETARPIMTKTLNFLKKYIISSSGTQLPAPNDSHREKICLMFKEMKETIQKHNPKAKFYVSHYAMAPVTSPYYDECLRKHHIASLKPPRLESKENETVYPYEYSPTPLATRIMARGLYETLKKAEGRN